MLLPRPYPDELVGSLLIRSSRRLGLSMERLAKISGLEPPQRPSFIVPAHLSRLGSYTNVDPEILLVSHIVFPFLAAIASPQDIVLLRESAMTGDGTSVAASYRSQYPLQAGITLLRRFCRACRARIKMSSGRAIGIEHTCCRGC